MSQEKWLISDVALLQVIGIRGHNPSGRCLIVVEIICPCSIIRFL